MDFVFAILMSIVTPFVLNYKGVQYTTNFGLLISDNTFTSKFLVSSEPLRKETDYKVQRVTYNGINKIDYEVMFSHKVPINIGHFWISPHTSWAPLQHQLLTIMQSPSSLNTTAKAQIFSEGIATGIKIGYDFSLGSENDLFVASPYLGLSFMQLRYEGLAYYDVNASLDSAMKVSVGVDLRVDYHWHFLLEGSGYKFNFYGIPDNKQDVNVTVFKIKAGVVYYLESKLGGNVTKKNKVYNDVVAAIDPYLAKRQKDAREQEDLKKAAARKQEALKKAARKQEALKKAARKQDKQSTEQETLHAPAENEELVIAEVDVSKT